MNKLKRVCCFLLAALALSSCAEMPESLKESETEATAPAVVTVPVTDESGNTVGTESVEFQPAERGDIEAIRAQLDYDLQKTYKNITVERARAGEGSVMPTYNVTVGRAEDFDIYAYAEYLYGDRYDVHDESLWTHKKVGDPYYDDVPVTTEPTMQPDGSILNQNCMTYALDAYRPTNNDDVNFHLITNTKGGTWGSPVGSSLPENTYYPDAFETAAQFDLDYDEIPADLSYKMYDGEEWNLREAVAFAESFFNNEIAPADPDSFTYRVKTVQVKSLPQDTYGYYFKIQFKDENGNFYDEDRRYLRDNAAIESGNEFLIDNYAACWCSEKELLTNFTKDYSYDLGDATDSGDSLLTLGAASDLLSEKLAQNANLSFTAELNYVLVCKKYPYYELWEYPEYYEDMAVSTCDLLLKPYWCFRKNLPLNSSDASNAETYFVDALTGEIIAMAYGRVERR